MVADARYGNAGIDDQSCVSGQLKDLLRAEGQLDHPLQQLIAGKPREVALDQLLGIEADKIAELERLATRGEYKVAMAIVDDDKVALASSFGTPSPSSLMLR